MSDTIGSPGSATYNSSTLYVGDGTWDNDFLLPNLVGLNFATMQYNGTIALLSGYYKGHEN